ncbi:MAG: magnesium transporter [candidate division KSB1 bacterium]|nr:magnesium transporter [candidate division KSB1 bacterium]
MTDMLELREIIENLSYLIDAGEDSKIKSIIIDSHPADLADILSEINEDKRGYLFNLLPTQTAAYVLMELDEVTREHLLPEIDSGHLVKIIHEMDSDDSADLISEMDETTAKNILSRIEPHDRIEVQKLLRHKEDSAGGIMALEFIAVYEDQTVDDAIQEIRQRAQEVEHVFHVYAVDRGGRLVGVVPIKQLFLRNPARLIRDIMKHDVISVTVDMDQESVANIVSKYDLLAVPVVDKHNRLVGRITIDDIVDVLQDEANEDIQRMAGISDEEILQETSPLRISRNRLPWLIIAFFGQICAALILSRFEVTIAEIAALTFFIPVIMAMGGNVGIQSSTIIVRGLALDEGLASNIWSMFYRELRVALLNGVLLGLLLFSFIWLWRGEPLFGLVVGLAMIFVIINSAIFGSIIPFVLTRFNLDPAIATGPFITTTNDILGLFIYLTMATAYLNYIS